ncbi:MAG: nucleotidyltransferase family protein [Anaerolineaceae bacterium]|nr:nucleotidyltransferase family protein [Anaerolineaceae bacterium]
MGIRSLSMFGSVARGEATHQSDIDLLVDLEPPLTFDRYIQAKFYLENLLDCPVDLVMADTLKPRARIAAQQEAIRVA